MWFLRMIKVFVTGSRKTSVDSSERWLAPVGHDVSRSDSSTTRDMHSDYGAVSKGRDKGQLKVEQAIKPPRGSGSIALLYL